MKKNEPVTKLYKKLNLNHKYVYLNYNSTNTSIDTTIIDDLRKELKKEIKLNKARNWKSALKRRR